VAVKSRQFTADKTRKGQFLRGNRRNLAEEEVMRKSSSPSPPQRGSAVPTPLPKRWAEIARQLDHPVAPQSSGSEVVEIRV